MANGTIADLREQWINPSDVSTILMVVGGDIVQSAFAQGTGKLYTPVCFSFGCVNYAFMSLVNIIGEGRLLPRPDYPAKVFNLQSGYARENKNWVVGRLLRDIEAKEPIHDGMAIRISIFNALKNGNAPTKFSWCFMHIVGALLTTLQFIIAAIPVILGGQWGILLITVAGTILVQLTGLLPQWTAEKLPNRQHSDGPFVITSGNGSREIVVIYGQGSCLNLEDLSAAESPRVNRPWVKFPWLLTIPKADQSGETARPGTQRKQVRTLHRLPLGFRLTQIACAVLSVFWLILLVNLAASQDYTWCILAVGTLGVFQNAWLAAAEVPSENRNIPLEPRQPHPIIMRSKVMDAIMDFEVWYGNGALLRNEFFPGHLRAEEIEWWQGNRQPYDEVRRTKADKRGWPASTQSDRPVSNSAQSDRPVSSSAQSDRPATNSARKSQLHLTSPSC